MGQLSLSYFRGRQNEYAAVVTTVHAWRRNLVNANEG